MGELKIQSSGEKSFRLSKFKLTAISSPSTAVSATGGTSGATGTGGCKICSRRSVRSSTVAAVRAVGAAAGQGESTTDLAWDGHALIYENGNRLAESDRFCAEEQLIVADIDLARVREERQNFDPTGHYGRPDIFDLRVDRRRLAVADLSEDPPSLG